MTGVWLIGARGSVAVTAVTGAAALRAGLADSTGCVTAGREFADAGLPGYADLVFGGHDVSEVSILKRAAELAADGVLPADLPAAVADELRAADAAIRPGVRTGDDRPARERINGLMADLRDFRTGHRLRRVVVVNVASTEPPHPLAPAHRSLAALEAALDDDTAGLAPSSEYAYAALRAGCPYIDFTPSAGVRLPALDELARTAGLPYAGSDAKTGETLLVSALAPMLTSRALRVRSWSGTNLLGGGDGATLADAGAAESKTLSKRRGLERMLGGGPVDGRTHIDHVPAQGGWKTAWDHVGFEGFLGVRMTMQVTWQGCDSALAAPLVLDLARLLARAHETGAAGAFGPAAFFFKDPVAADGGEVDYRLAAQYDALVAWAASVSGSGSGSDSDSDPHRGPGGVAGAGAR